MGGPDPQRGRGLKDRSEAGIPVDEGLGAHVESLDRRSRHLHVRLGETASLRPGEALESSPDGPSIGETVPEVDVAREITLLVSADATARPPFQLSGRKAVRAEKDQLLRGDYLPVGAERNDLNRVVTIPQRDVQSEGALLVRPGEVQGPTRLSQLHIPPGPDPAGKGIGPEEGGPQVWSVGQAHAPHRAEPGPGGVPVAEAHLGQPRAVAPDFPVARVHHPLARRS